MRINRMNRRVARVHIFLATTLVVVNSALALEPTDIIEVTVCDLAQRPQDFENRHVRVHDIIQTGPEFLGFTYNACPSIPNKNGNAIWLDFPGDFLTEDEFHKYYRGWSLERYVQAVHSGELRGDGPSVPWQTPLPLASPDHKEMKRLSRALKRAKDRGVEAVVTGRFDYSGSGLLVQSSGGALSFLPGFGHLNCCSGRIVVERIEVVAVPT